MEDHRSGSHGHGDRRMQAEVHGTGPPPPPAGFSDGMRCYGASRAPAPQPQREGKPKKHKGGRGSSSTSKGGWSLSDPEMQRKKRVASYKVYAVEGKMKGSLRKTVRWIKDRCSQVVYGWW